MTDKTQSQTYNFLSKNKSIEDIKKQENIEVKEIKNKRHGGKTYRIDNVNHQLVNHDLSENNRKNLESVTSNLTNEVKEQEINNDIWTKFKNYLNWPTSNTKELIEAQKKYIEQLEQSNLEKDKENQQLKNAIEKLKQSKQASINLDNFKYNVITTYDEKQRKKTGIEKIHEEILCINNQLYFITTLVHIDNSISEEVLYFDYYENNNDLQVINQTKKYQNINEYKKNNLLIENISTSNTNNQFTIIKNFLKQQTLEKLKPTKKEWKIWSIIIGITFFLGIIVPICTFAIPALIPATATVLVLETKVIIAVSFAVAGIVFKEISSLYENATQKVKSWFKNKNFKNKDQNEKEKKERESKIENLTNNDLEKRLKTQYDILKQELDNRKDKRAKELINDETINHKSNSVLENSSIESENNQNFDSSIKNKVNNQGSQPSTISANTWNKVKCLLTT